MKATRSLKVKSVLTVLLVVMELVTVSADALAAPAMKTTLELPDGIALTGAFTDDDFAYLQDNLQMLHDRFPTWWQYLVESGPVTLALDEILAAYGRAAEARCCDEQGRGVVKLGHHLGQLSMTSDAEDQAAEAKRITFLGVLVHELTHIRDQRAGRFTVKTNRKSCVAAESSGLTQQLEFKRDLASGQLFDDPATAEIYRLVLDHQIKVDSADLHSRVFWDLYCGAFES